MPSIQVMISNLRLFSDRLDQIDEDIVTAESIDLVALDQAIDQVDTELNAIEEAVDKAESEAEEDPEQEEDIELEEDEDEDKD